MSMMAPEPMMQGPPPGGPEQGLPPELAQMLMGGAPPAGPGSATSPPDGSGGPADILRSLIDAAHAYLQAEQDDEDLAAMNSILAKMQTLLAKQQREQDAAMGIGPQQKAMRRAAANGA